MKHVLRPALWAVAGAALLAVAACGKNETQTSQAPAESITLPATETAPPPAPAVDIAAEERAINTLNQQWLTIINGKDAQASANMYADDGGIFAPNQPAAIGPDAVLTTWQQLVSIPGMALDLHTTKLLVASSGDMAVETGTYTMKSGDPVAPTVDNGKYVVTWVKRNGEWKVLTDMFNSDGPAAAAPSTATAPEGTAAPEGTTEGAPAEDVAPSAPPAGTP